MPYLLAFITLFAAIDVVALLPVYHALTAELAPDERRSILRQSCLTALLAAVVFLFGGRLVFRLLGIEVYDFKAAGGLLLLLFSVQDLGGRERSHGAGAAAGAAAARTLGVVPIGVPLIVGPAVLTTLLIIVDEHGYGATLAALALNLALVAVVLGAAPRLLARIGEGGARALGKIASLFLAAIGVMMIRRGVVEMIRASFP